VGSRLKKRYYGEMAERETYGRVSAESTHTECYAKTHAERRRLMARGVFDMDHIRKLRGEIYSQSAPIGFSASAEDLDILVYQYGDSIMGRVSFYLAGEKIDPTGIDLNAELDQNLEECLTKLNELKAYKQKFDAIARYLIGELSSDSPV
jgi:hypothetical protein